MDDAERVDQDTQFSVKNMIENAMKSSMAIENMDPISMTMPPLGDVMSAVARSQQSQQSQSQREVRNKTQRIKEVAKRPADVSARDRFHNMFR